MWHAHAVVMLTLVWVGWLVRFDDSVCFCRLIRFADSVSYQVSADRFLPLQADSDCWLSVLLVLALVWVGWMIRRAAIAANRHTG